jgi:RHS repeat-associated protein
MPIKSVPVAYNQAQAVDSEMLQIAYQYDPLNRLKEANYSDGSYFHYIYDEVGNRLSETTLNGTKTYVYDEASRLTSVNGTTYTWDNNGNLLSDGDQSYAYDHENRLKTVVDGAETYSYGYNGHDDRVRQTINGVTTSYLLDINAGLTQVLSDETNTYLYGMNRIAQYAGAQPQYYLGDALDSVRQVTDINDAVLLAQSFDPFGNPLKHQGTETSSFGYAGEQTDQTGLQFLRARYYSPIAGRFITQDLWVGDYFDPTTLNRFSYATSNPIAYTDPTGYYRCSVQSENYSVAECKKDVDLLLKTLAETGGKTGEQLVRVFNTHDSARYCWNSEYLGYCTILYDQITVNVSDNAGLMYWDGFSSLNIGTQTIQKARLSREDLLVTAGMLGHEIRHIQQTQLVNPSILAELDAYDTEAQIFKSMGIQDSSNGFVIDANGVSGLRGKPLYEILESPFGRRYTQEGYTTCKLLYWADKPIRSVTEWWYKLRH